MNIPWYKRFNIGAGITWNLLPGSTMTWREWLFSPDGSLQRPGTKVAHRNVMGEWAKVGIDMDWDSKVGLTSNSYRMGSALRILGFDFGIEIYYRPFKETDRKL